MVYLLLRVWSRESDFTSIKIKENCLTHARSSMSQAVFYLGRYSVIGSVPDCKSGVFGCWRFESFSIHWYKIWVSIQMVKGGRL